MLASLAAGLQRGFSTAQRLSEGGSACSCFNCFATFKSSVLLGVLLQVDLAHFSIVLFQVILACASTSCSAPNQQWLASSSGSVRSQPCLLTGTRSFGAYPLNNLQHMNRNFCLFWRPKTWLRQLIFCRQSFYTIFSFQQHCCRHGILQVSQLKASLLSSILQLFMSNIADTSSSPDLVSTQQWFCVP